jgi:pimeloyl-ACP methyl ester carboxylesterase
MAKTFVLVHGAWHGGWCWVRVADRLQAQGHAVYRPTMTGLGERAHLMSANIHLATHITDIVNVFKFERLSDVVLCGHSYGGMIISGVAEQVGPAISSIVFLDAFLPKDGDTVLATTSPLVRESTLAAIARGDIAVPPRSAELFGVNEKDRAWVDALVRPHPLATITDKIALTGARERIARKTYIRATDNANAGYDAALAQAKADPTWRTYELPCGHDVMVDMPERLTEILLEVA